MTLQLNFLPKNLRKTTKTFRYHSNISKNNSINQKFLTLKFHPLLITSYFYLNKFHKLNRNSRLCCFVFRFFEICLNLLKLSSTCLSTFWSLGLKLINLNVFLSRALLFTTLKGILLQRCMLWVQRCWQDLGKIFDDMHTVFVVFADFTGEI